MLTQWAQGFVKVESVRMPDRALGAARPLLLSSRQHVPGFVQPAVSRGRLSLGILDQQGLEAPDGASSGWRLNRSQYTLGGDIYFSLVF